MSKENKCGKKLPAKSSEFQVRRDLGVTKKRTRGKAQRFTIFGELR